MTASVKKITAPMLRRRKSKGLPVAMVTAYDATFARLIDQTDVDVMLVGDSLGMVVQGHPNTVPVTLDDMIYHTRAVSRVTRRAHVCGDMPFMANKVSVETTLAHAARLVQKGRAESVKLEGGQNVARAVETIVSAGIPVMGHVGMTPQSVHAFGGFKKQGKSADAQRRILDDAIAVAEAGAFMVVLESIPADLAKMITDAILIPTIGIGAGPHCDGQVLVSYDLLGLTPDVVPPFVKQYATLGKMVKTAVSTFAHEVKSHAYPAVADNPNQQE